MTREEAIEVLKDIYNYTRFDTKTINEARTMAIKALEQEPCDDTVSRGVFEQVMWERDTAIEQLRELGYELGQKIEPCDDCVSRQAVKNGMIKYGFHASDMTVTEFVEDLPPVTPKREQGEWKMIHRHHNEVKKYTGIDLMGDKHTIYVHEEYEGNEPYCFKCGKRADDLGQRFCGYCGVEITEREEV